MSFSIPSAFATVKGLRVFPVLYYTVPGEDTLILSTVPLVIDGTTALPYLAQEPTFKHDAKVTGTGTAETLSISLIDPSEDAVATILANSNDTLIHVEFHLVATDADMVVTDRIILFDGEIWGGFVFDDDSHIATAEADSYIKSAEVGYSSAFGNDAMWPIIFGDVLRLPTTNLMYDTPTSGIVTREAVTDATTEIDVVTKGNFELDAGALTISLDGIILTVNASGTTLTVVTANDPYYEAVAITTNAQGEPDTLTVIGDVMMAGLYLTVTYGGKTLVNRCVQQIGNDLYFSNPWRDHNGVALTLSTGTIVAACKVPDPSWAPYYINGQYVATYSWGVPNGTEIKILSDEVSNKHVICDGSSTSVVGVYGVYTPSGGKAELRPLASRYFTINTADTVDSRTCTTLTLKKPMGDIGDTRIGSWDDDLYVSVRSGNTKNAVEIVQSILETYTTMLVDSTTFTAAATLVDAFECNFAITEKKDAITLCEEIAWQCACALYTKGNTVYIRYLGDISGELPASCVWGSDDIGNDRLKLASISPDDVLDQVSGTWRKDLYIPDSHVMRYTSKSTGNMTRGTEEFNFYIFAHETLVKRFLYFYGYRKCQTWPTLNVMSYLHKIGVDPYDRLSVDFTFPQAGNVAYTGEVTSIEVNTADMTTGVSMVVPMQGAVQDNNYWLGDPTAPLAGAVVLDDLLADEAIVDYAEPRWWSSIDKDKDKDPKYAVKFTTQPTIVVRDVDFTLRLEIHDKDGDIKKVDEDVVIYIYQTTEPDDKLVYGADVDGTVNGTFVDGVLEITAFNITAGLKRGAICYLIAYVPDKLERYAHGVSTNITVNNEFNYVKFVSVPDYVYRGEPFPVVAQGDPEKTWNVAVVSEDESDVLTPNTMGVPVSGEFTAIDWSIDGGTTGTTGKIRASLDGDVFDSRSFIIIDAKMEPRVVKITGLHGSTQSGEGEIQYYTVTEYPNGPLGSAGETGLKGVPVAAGTGGSHVRLQTGSFHMATLSSIEGSPVYYIMVRPLEPAVGKIVGFTSYATDTAVFTVDILDGFSGSTLNSAYTAKIRVGHWEAGTTFEGWIGMGVNLFIDTVNQVCIGALSGLPDPADDQVRNALVFDPTSGILWTTITDQEVVVDVKIEGGYLQVQKVQIGVIDNEEPAWANIISTNECP